MLALLSMAACVDAVIRRNAKTARIPTKSIWTSDDAFEIHSQQRSTSVKLRNTRDDLSSWIISDQPGSCGSRALRKLQEVGNLALQPNAYGGAASVAEMASGTNPMKPVEEGVDEEYE